MHGVAITRKVLSKQANRHDWLSGLNTSAITRHGSNGFKDYYERMLSNGIIPANDRHSVARKMMSVMSAKWNTDSAFDPKLL